MWEIGTGGASGPHPVPFVGAYLPSGVGQICVSAHLLQGSLWEGLLILGFSWDLGADACGGMKGPYCTTSFSQIGFLRRFSPNAWLVRRLREQGAGGSNPLIPTIQTIGPWLTPGAFLRGAPVPLRSTGLLFLRRIVVLPYREPPAPSDRRTQLVSKCYPGAVTSRDKHGLFRSSSSGRDPVPDHPVIFESHCNL